MTQGTLTLLSCGLGVLPPDAAPLLREADVVYGASRLLPLVAACTGPDAELRPLAAQARADAATALELACAGRKVVVLASGDALFHGIGGVLADLLANVAEASRPVVRSVPGVTAFQALFHRLGLPWDQARVFSAHHTGALHGDALPLRDMLAAPLAVIYAGSRHTAPDIAARLLHVQPEAATRRAVLADSLGTPGERLVSASLSELARETASPTAMLLLLPHSPAPVLPLGLPVEAFEREAGLITAPDVRAVILSRLRLPAWGHLWDIGAGSGSIGLEAAALCPGLTVTAVERHPARVAMIRRNATRLGLGNHRTLEGAFPDVLAASPDLSPPQRIVVGGGGADLTPMLEICLARLTPGGILVVPTVTLESQHRLYHWRPELRTGLLSVHLAEERPLAGIYHHLEPQRPIHLYCYTKPEGHA